MTSDDDDDDAADTNETDSSFEMRKRARTGESAEPDPERRVRSLDAFLEGEDENATVIPFPLVHAADVTSVQKPGKFQSAFGEEGSGDVLLQYPSAAQKERYAFLILVGGLR